MEPTVSLAKQVQLLLPFSSMFNWTVWKMLWQKGTQDHVDTKLGDPPAGGRERLPGALGFSWGQESKQVPACWHGFGRWSEREELLPFSVERGWGESAPRLTSMETEGVARPDVIFLPVEDVWTLWDSWETHQESRRRTMEETMSKVWSVLDNLWFRHKKNHINVELYREAIYFTWKGWEDEEDVTQCLRAPGLL